jgi:hypothetical protein
VQLELLVSPTWHVCKSLLLTDKELCEVEISLQYVSLLPNYQETCLLFVSKYYPPIIPIFIISKFCTFLYNVDYSVSFDCLHKIWDHRMSY